MMSLNLAKLDPEAGKEFIAGIRRAWRILLRAVARYLRMLMSFWPAY